MTKYLKLLLVFFFIFCLQFNTNATENRIIYKINNEIVTIFDLNVEFRYLSLINPNILNLTKNEIFKIAENSIITEKVKKIELLNHLDNIVLDEKYVNELLKQNYLKIGLQNKSELEIKLNEIGFNLEDFVQKISIDALWNQLIYEKYFSKVKIDKLKLKEEISEKKKTIYI